MFWGITGGVISILCALIPYILSQREKTLRYWQIEAESIFSNKIKEIGIRISRHRHESISNLKNFLISNFNFLEIYSIFIILIRMSEETIEIATPVIP